MNRFVLRTRPWQYDAGALFVRLILGGLMIYSGQMKIYDYDKILPLFGDPIGLGTKLSFNLLIFSEFFCGILVVIGLFTRLAVLPIMFSMGVAFFVAMRQSPFPEKELPFVFLALSIPVFFMGSGNISVDRLLYKKTILT